MLLDQKRRSLAGKVQKLVADMVVDEDRFHKRVPDFSNTMVRQLMTQDTQDKLKGLIRRYEVSFRSWVRTHTIVQPMRMRLIGSW